MSKRAPLTNEPNYLEDAALVYALARSYLCDAKVDSHGVTNAAHVHEIGFLVFEVWEGIIQKAGDELPAAVCSYNGRAQQWKIELKTGETLILCDKGYEWEILQEEASGTAKASSSDFARYIEGYRRRQKLFQHSGKTLSQQTARQDSP